MQGIENSSDATANSTLQISFEIEHENIPNRVDTLHVTLTQRRGFLVFHYETIKHVWDFGEGFCEYLISLDFIQFCYLK